MVNSQGHKGHLHVPLLEVCEGPVPKRHSFLALRVSAFPLGSLIEGWTQKRANHCSALFDPKGISSQGTREAIGIEMYHHTLSILIQTPENDDQKRCCKCQSVVVITHAAC